MVASGAGIAVVAAPLALATRPVRVVFRPLREPSPVLDLAAAWRRDGSSPNPRAFLELVREFAPVWVRSSDSRSLLDSYTSLEAS